MDQAQATLSRAPEAVETQIDYLIPTSRINRRFWAPGAELNTGIYAPYPVTIRNARLAAEPFTLDRHGFCLARHDTKVTDWRDSAAHRRSDPRPGLLRLLPGHALPPPP